MKPFRDLREWLEIIESAEGVKTISGAHWDLEIGMLCEAIERSRRGPAILFDSVSGYPAGYRVLCNSLGSFRRLAISLGLTPETDVMELMKQWRQAVVVSPC